MSGAKHTAAPLATSLRRANITPLRIAAYAAIVISCSWYMLGQLVSVLRPLVLAIILGYVLLPSYNRLRLRMPAPIALGLIAGGASLFLIALAAGVTSSILDLTTQGPDLKAKAVNQFHSVSEWLHSYRFLGPTQDVSKPLETQLATWATDGAVAAASLVAVGLPEVFAAGLYLLFLLMEAGQFPNRVRRAYPSERASEILNIFGAINAAIISFLKAKVLSSLVLALPVAVVLMAFGVKFALLWAVLTFVCNFIPYIGSVVACSIPIGFATLQFPDWSTPITIGVLVLSWHVLSAAVIEPMMVGRAVGISPVVILAALSVWGVLWGLPGMFLAVPLTVVAKIVLEHIPLTRSVAKLAGEERENATGSHHP